MSKRIVALLPMKAHSERVPGKNFRPIAGKPLVKWILDALLEVDTVTKVVINTDARELLEEIGVVDSDRVLIRDRKQELCGDMVSMNLILQDDIAAVGADSYLMTHTTNPLISAATLRDAIAHVEENDEADSLFSVNRIQTRFYKGDGEAVNHDPDNLVRTQDLEPWFEENSCLYLFSQSSFAETGARIGKQPMMYETPPLESLDIDEPHEWFLAEAVLEKRERELATE
jgi:CMP-N-acetylneuraminic acid synthetase